MYSPATRLLTILDVLQARPGITAGELAERLEVDKRSIRRYITMLQDLGIPVVRWNQQELAKAIARSSE